MCSKENFIGVYSKVVSTRWYLWGTFFAGVGGLSGYIFLILNPEFPIKKFLAIVAAIVAAVVILVLIIYRITNKKEKKQQKEITTLKKPVNTNRVLQIWKEQMIIENEIPYRVDHNKKIHPLNDKAIMIRNTKRHTDPLFQTADEFLAFEAIITQGKSRGMLMVVLNVDMGEDHIKDNWQSRNTWNTSFATHDPMHRRYPLTSSKSHAERLASTGLNLLNEGYTAEEAKQAMIPLLLANKTAQPLPEEKQEIKSSIKAPEVDDEADVKKETKGVDTGDVDEDINAFRRRNK